MLVARLIYSLIEGVLLTGAGPGLLGKKLKGKGLFTTGLLFGLIALGVRFLYDYFQFTAISHTYVLMAILALMLWQINKLKFFQSLVASVLSTSLLLVSEIMFLFPVMQYWSITPELILLEPLFFIVGAILSLFGLILATLGVYLFNFALITEKNIGSSVEEKEKV